MKNYKITKLQDMLCPKSSNCKITKLQDMLCPKSSIHFQSATKYYNITLLQHLYYAIY